MGGEPAVDLAATSTEYVHVPVATTDATAPDLSAARIAIVDDNGNPADADWHDADLHEGNARLLVGPEGGALTLSAGVPYTVWVTWAAGAETPVYRAGRIRVY